jgi:hypothetical protein
MLHQMMGMKDGDVLANESSTRLSWFVRRSFAARSLELERLLDADQANVFTTISFQSESDKAAIAKSKFYLGLVKTCASTAPLPILLAVQQCCQHPPRNFSVITSASADNKCAASISNYR